MAVRFFTLSRGDVPGTVNGWFGAGQLGGGAEYAAALIYNDNPSLSVTAGKLYLRPDPAGGGFAIAVLDATARTAGYDYGTVTPSTGSYSSPTDNATGLVIATLAANQQVLIGVKRDLSSGSEAHPEANVIHFDGTVVAGYT